MGKRTPAQANAQELLVLRVSQKEVQSMRITSQTRPPGIRPHARNIHVLGHRSVRTTACTAKLDDEAVPGDSAPPPLVQAQALTEHCRPMARPAPSARPTAAPLRVHKAPRRHTMDAELCAHHSLRIHTWLLTHAKHIAGPPTAMAEGVLPATVTRTYLQPHPSAPPAPMHTSVPLRWSPSTSSYPAYEKRPRSFA